MATTSTTVARNPIAPAHASHWWGVVSFVVLLAVLAAVAALVWLFVSYRQHLRDHDLDHENWTGP
jgi:heme/copper-type cytochrome/quinol oxidase subunit 2